MAPATADTFRRDFRSAQADVQAGVVSSRARAAAGHWNTWHTFCQQHSLDPTLQEFQDPVPYLQVFAYRYRTGAIAPHRNPVRARTVEDALRSVGQTFAGVGAPDPRITPQGKIDFRIQRQLACYGKQDPPPNRVKPIPVPILRHVLATALQGAAPGNIAIADMITLAFFFLLRPGEYTGSSSDTKFDQLVCP